VVEKPILDTADDAAYVGCGVGLSKVEIRNRFRHCARASQRYRCGTVSISFGAGHSSRYIVARERRWVASHE
jgi:hypothetical protein